MHARNMASSGVGFLGAIGSLSVLSTRHQDAGDAWFSCYLSQFVGKHR